MKTHPRLFLLLFFGTHLTFSQSFDWNRHHAAISVDALLPDGDFGRFWNTAAALGGILRYDVNEAMFLIGRGAVASVKTRDGVNKGEIPDFTYLIFSGEVHRRLLHWKFFHVEGGLGLANHTFMFRGSAATLYHENTIESEMGFLASLALSMKVKGVPEFVVQSTHHTILSSPERIGIWMLGVALYFY